MCEDSTTGAMKQARKAIAIASMRERARKHCRHLVEFLPSMVGRNSCPIVVK